MIPFTHANCNLIRNFTSNVTTAKAIKPFKKRSMAWHSEVVILSSVLYSTAAEILKPLHEHICPIDRKIKIKSLQTTGCSAEWKIKLKKQLSKFKWKNTIFSTDLCLLTSGNLIPFFSAMRKGIHIQKAIQMLLDCIYTKQKGNLMR